MARKRGSRSSRGKTSVGQKLAPVSIIFQDPAEEIRLTCVAWMEEMAEIHRLEAERVASVVQRIRDEQEMRQQRMDESRHARKQKRKQLIAERRAASRKSETVVSRDTLNPTGLSVRHHAAFREIDGKVFRIMYTEDISMKQSIEEVRQRVAERSRLEAARKQAMCPDNHNYA